MHLCRRARLGAAVAHRQSDPQSLRRISLLEAEPVAVLGCFREQSSSDYVYCGSSEIAYWQPQHDCGQYYSILPTPHAGCTIVSDYVYARFLQALTAAIGRHSGGRAREQ